MYNSSGSTLSLTKNKFIKIVPAKKERKERKKKNEKISYLGMLQSFAKSMSGFNTGEEAQKVANRTWIYSLQSSLWNMRKRVRKEFALWGWGRLCLLVFGYETETAKHLFVFKNYVLAAQSSPFKVQTVLRWKWACCVVLCYREMDSNRNTSAWCTWFLFCSLYTAICSLLAALRITRRSDCLIQGQNFEVKKKVSFGIWNCH